MSKDELLELLEFYEVPDDNGITYYEGNVESSFIKKLNLEYYDEDFCYVEYKKDTTLLEILNNISYVFEYDIPKNIIENNNNIDFVIFIDDPYLDVKKKNYFYKDDNLLIKYIGFFDSYIKSK